MQRDPVERGQKNPERNRRQSHNTVQEGMLLNPLNHPLGMLTLWRRWRVGILTIRCIAGGPVATTQESLEYGQRTRGPAAFGSSSRT